MPEPLKLDPLVITAERVLNRTQQKWPGWWDNFAQNLPYSRAGLDAYDLQSVHKGKPAIVIGAGPSLTLAKLRLLKLYKDKLVFFATDRTLKSLLQVGIEPHYVMTVDGDPSVADFYRNIPADKHRRTKVVLNAITTHPETRAAAMNLFFTSIYWFLSFFDDPQMPTCSHCGRVSVTAGFAFMTRKRGILQALGNAGAACWHLAYFTGSNPIFLIGMDYSYTPNTPIEKTHYYDAYCKIAATEHLANEAMIIFGPEGGSKRVFKQQEIEAHVVSCLKCRQRVKSSYEIKTNPDLKQDYMLDKIWGVYRDLLMPFILRAQSQTVNCSGGALHGPRIRGMELEEALAKYVS